MIVMEVASASFVSLILIKYSIYYFVYPKYNIASFEEMIEKNVQRKYSVIVLHILHMKC